MEVYVIRKKKKKKKSQDEDPYKLLQLVSPSHFNCR